MGDIRTIYLAGGCFWGVQKFLDQFEGIVRTEVGYANGPDKAPTYEDVCRGSGHAETVRVDFDEGRITLEQLLRNYLMIIDPTSVNRQGHDVGLQYRTGIYYTDPSMIDTIMMLYDEEQDKHSRPLAIGVEPLENFFPAEEYHQKYLEKNPHGYCHIPQYFFNIAQSE